jgi:bifunctional UDP-N-acetylglucosamine pyrophosphorylase/glucosamine-1-phosphate N-acetyltransferase
MKLAAVVLAAGEGTRMKSRLPKPLYKLAGRPLVSYAVDTLQQVADSRPVLIVGHGGDLVRQAVGDRAVFVEQKEQRGTGHALLQARQCLKGKSNLVLVTYVDMPLLTADTLRGLGKRQEENDGPVTLLSVKSENPRGFGRLIRDAQGSVVRIVEEALADADERELHELNVGAYCFAGEWLWSHVDRIPASPPKKEYYLTDLIGMAAEEGLSVEAVSVADPQEALGINNQAHLAEAEAALRDRINRQWMLEGVTIVDPATTYIEPGVTIGVDTTILPNTHLRGSTAVGPDCEIGPNSVIVDCRIGAACRVVSSVLEQAVMEDGCDIGPFGHLRAGAHLCEGAHMGNFGEVKNATLGPGAKMGHFSYLGDAEVGAGANIAAGTITCNYDGKRKHKTVIEEGAFIGSDTMLVAPVRVGKGARTGAGSVVTHDVPEGKTAYGVPARVVSGDDDDGEDG